MKVGLIAVVLLVAVVAVVGYTWIQGVSFGIDEDHPLGQFSVVDEHLTDVLGLSKSEIELTDLPEMLEGGATAYKYLDDKKTEEYETEEVVWVVLGEDGEIMGVGGTWVTRQDAWSTYSTKAMEFVIGMWGKTGGTKPDFHLRNGGRRVRAQEWDEATFDTVDLDGVWLRFEHSRKDMITIALK